VLLWVNGYLTRGHVAIITETESTYILIESTLQFDDVEDIPSLLPLLPVVQRSCMRSRERSGRRPGNEARWGSVSRHSCESVMHGCSLPCMVSGYKYLVLVVSLTAGN